MTIDFEASCLPRHGRSFPIEVGISGAGMTRSWLIRPHIDWTGWDWSDRAQALHGLTLAQIEGEGLPAAQICTELAMAVAGHRVVADSLIDQYWLDTLAAAAGIPSPFAIDHVSMVMEEMGVTEAAITAAVAQADMMVGIRHRAASDAAWLAVVLGQLGAPMAQPLWLAPSPPTALIEPNFTPAPLMTMGV